MRTRIVWARRISLVALGVASAVPLACSKDKPAETGGLGGAASFGFGGQPSASGSAWGTQPPPGSAWGTQPPPQGSQSAVAPAASSSGPPLAPTFTTDPNQLAQLFAAAAAAGAALLQQPGVGLGDPAEACVKAQAAKVAPGMQPEGQIAKGNLQQGGHLEFLTNLQGGRCYTIVGCSPAGGVQDLDLNLLAPPFYNVLAGQDGTSDNMPVIGKAPSPMCPIVPLALAYKVDIFAKKGAGAVAVQVYAKNK
jgi:hypothetical protein